MSLNTGREPSSPLPTSLQSSSGLQAQVAQHPGMHPPCAFPGSSPDKQLIRLQTRVRDCYTTSKDKDKGCGFFMHPASRPLRLTHTLKHTHKHTHTSMHSHSVHTPNSVTAPHSAAGQTKTDSVTECEN